MVELVDTPDLRSDVNSWEFESPYAHQTLGGTVQVKITGKVKERAPHLRKFINWLQVNHPVVREGVQLEVKLSSKEFIPFHHTDGTIGEAQAVLSIYRCRPTVRIATGGLWCYPKRILIDYAHEHRHLQQYFDEGQNFKTMASEEEYLQDALELDANEFSKRVIKEYLEVI